MNDLDLSILSKQNQTIIGLEHLMNGINVNNAKYKN